MSNFGIIREIVEGDAVVYLKGYLSGQSGELLEEEIRQLLLEDGRSIVINFGDTSMVNSVGISFLISIIEMAGHAGCALAFSDLSSVNEEVFRLMGLHRHVKFLKPGSIQLKRRAVERDR